MRRIDGVFGPILWAQMLIVIGIPSCSHSRSPLQGGDAQEASVGPDQDGSAQQDGDAAGAAPVGDASAPSDKCLAGFSADLRQGLSSVGYSGRCGVGGQSANTVTFDDRGKLVKLNLVDSRPVYDALTLWASGDGAQRVWPCLATQVLPVNCAPILGG